jgi:hypothetical protein
MTCRPLWGLRRSVSSSSSEHTTKTGRSVPEEDEQHADHLADVLARGDDQRLPGDGRDVLRIVQHRVRGEGVVREDAQAAHQAPEHLAHADPPAVAEDGPPAQLQALDLRRQLAEGVLGDGLVGVQVHQRHRRQQRRQQHVLVVRPHRLRQAEQQPEDVHLIHVPARLRPGRGAIHPPEPRVPQPFQVPGQLTGGAQPLVGLGQAAHSFIQKNYDIIYARLNNRGHNLSWRGSC